jgi:coatomer subunit beta'
LNSKNRPKIAAGIARPVENPDLFEEGWEDALRQEQKVAPAAPIINGTKG